MRERGHRTCALCAAIALVGALAGSGCQDPFADSLTGAVITVVDSGPPLRDAVTFALPDTIVELASSVVRLGHEHDREITTSIRIHLLARGWTDLTGDMTARPDVLVLTAATSRIQTGVVYTDWYGAWGYLPYWSPVVTDAWSWTAPDGAVPYAFPAGTLLVTMIDLRAQREDERAIPLLWAAAIDGVISGAGPTADRAQVGIDQAFVQSPYLARTP